MSQGHNELMVTYIPTVNSTLYISLAVIKKVELREYNALNRLWSYKEDFVPGSDQIDPKLRRVI